MLSRKPPKGVQVQSGTQELGRAKAQKDPSRKERGTGNDHRWRTQGTTSSLNRGWPQAAPTTLAEN